MLARLGRDTRANVLAIVAASMIPLCGMIGGGLDLSRMYIVKTRLQHACDAGALAGRKAMGGGTWTQQNNMPRAMAERFFDANIRQDIYGADNISRSFSERAGKVSGTASAVVPMTLMRVFGQPQKTMAVTCETEMRLPNTDVMFVLDVTGSMNCVAGDSSCSNNNNVPAYNSKINGLKVAVKCFYEIVARLDTDANCEGGAPSGGTGNQVQIRFGFVPYASNVNVGRLLPTAYMADTANYNTRELVGFTWSGYSYYGWAQPKYYTGCNNVAPSDTDDTQYYTIERRGDNYYYCDIYVRHRNVAEWKYHSLPLQVSGLKNGTAWRDSFTARIGDGGSNVTINWSGCIEERKTVRANSYSPLPAGAKDLDIDLVPSSGDESTRWRPSLPEATFMRQSTSSNNTDALDRAEVPRTTTNYRRYLPSLYSFYCPTESKKLQVWDTASSFQNYVNSLRAEGNTYHDIGMIWGARLLSRTGIFADENALTPQGGEIERHLIFMTDGDATSAACDYNAYGIPYFDQRQTTDVGSASECRYQRTSLANQINARLSGLCTAIKNKNITLWVVSFGGDSNAATETRLEACASQGRYFKADDSAALQRTFRSIADQISALRLVK